MTIVTGTSCSALNSYWNVTCRDNASNTNTSPLGNFTVFAPPIVNLLFPPNIYANSTAKFGALQHYLRQTLRRWLWRKHGCKRAQYAHYTNDRLHGHYGLWSWPLHAAWTQA